jgi:hypothetical protein
MVLNDGELKTVPIFNSAPVGKEASVNLYENNIGLASRQLLMESCLSWVEIKGKVRAKGECT